jgi:hypothetical protein
MMWAYLLTICVTMKVIYAELSFQCNHKCYRIIAYHPRYIRDCIAGLRNADDVDTLQASLGTTEKLVREHPDDLRTR